MIRRRTASLVQCFVLSTLLFGSARAAAHGAESKLAYRLLGHSGPVIVFESGQGLGKASWDRVAPQLAACARVVVYDRAGIGESAASPNIRPVTADAVAGALAALLRTIGVPPPYILVGHSLGGLYVQSFARHYPKDVAAVVLVDASSPLEPPGAFVSTSAFAPGSISAAEEAGVAASMAGLLAGPKFPPIPLVVLVATDHGDTPQREALWLEVQSRTAALSPKGYLDVIRSGHFIQNDEPGAVIKGVLDAARRSGFNIAGCSKTVDRSGGTR